MDFVVRLGACAGILAFGSALSFGQWTTTVLNAPAFSYTNGYGFSGSYQVGSTFGSIVGRQYQAVMWSGSSQTMINLNPPGWASSYSFGGCDGFQVGSGRITNPGSWDSALLWSGTAASAINLHPTLLAFDSSEALAATKTHQVGDAFTGSEENSHAILWSGTAASAVDLNPNGYRRSVATAVGGDHQFGWAVKTPNSAGSHAVMWTGTANSLADLNPAGYDASWIYGATETNEVGYVYGINTNSYFHAGLWSGSTQSFLDLNPSWLDESKAVGVSAFGEAGYGIGAVTGTNHALLWTGTANSAVDLHSYLAGSQHDFLSSYATGIDDQGNVIGYAQASDSYVYAIRWTHVVPEPGSLLALGIGLVAFAKRKRPTIQD